MVEIFVAQGAERIETDVLKLSLAPSEVVFSKLGVCVRSSDMRLGFIFSLFNPSHLLSLVCNIYSPTLL